MNCQEFQGKIQNFIQDTLEPEVSGSFVHHVRNCADCYDELEIQYMIQVGLERMDDDKGQSLNLKKELQEQLQYYEQRSEAVFLNRLYGKIICIVAQSCTLILLILQIMKWISMN